MKEYLAVRALVATDWQILRNLEVEMNQIEPHLFTGSAEALQRIRNDEWIEDIQARDTGIYIAAFAEDQAVGIVMAAPPIRPHNHVYLANLYVRPHVRSQGIGRTLMQAAFDYAQIQGANSLALTVSAQNVCAKQWYERLGFQPHESEYMALYEHQDDEPPLYQELIKPLS